MVVGIESSEKLDLALLLVSDDLGKLAIIRSGLPVRDDRLLLYLVELVGDREERVTAEEEEALAVLLLLNELGLLEPTGTGVPVEGLDIDAVGGEPLHVEDASVID